MLGRENSFFSVCVYRWYQPGTTRDPPDCHLTKICLGPKELAGLPRWLRGKESACQCRTLRFSPWVEKIRWRRDWPPTPVLFSGKSHGQRSWQSAVHGVTKESDMTEQLKQQNSDKRALSVPHTCLSPERELRKRTSKRFTYWVSYLTVLLGPDWGDLSLLCLNPGQPWCLFKFKGPLDL